VFQKLFFWPLFAAIMGFALGGSYVFGLYGPQATAQYASNAAKHEPAEHDAKPKKEETDEALAYYTLWLMVFTGILAVATVALGGATFGLYLTGEKQIEHNAEVAGAQASAMQESIALAKISADAAKQSADVARDSLIHTQRAYVRVANFPWLWRGDTDRPGKFFYDITPIIENAGNTQTVDAKINVNWALRDDPLPEGFDFPFVAQHGFTLIGAHQSVGASNAVILDDDLLLVQSGTKYFYIWGVVNYRDVFPGTPERVTEFCAQISRVIGEPLDPRESGNPKGTTLEIYFRIYPEHQKTT
jgi:hypothetical protein